MRSRANHLPGHASTSASPLPVVLQAERQTAANMAAAAQLRAELTGAGQPSPARPQSAPVPLAKRPHDDGDAAEASAVLPPEKRRASEPAAADAEEDDVRLWEDGWHARYYETKFHISEQDATFMRGLVTAYVEGLCWVLQVRRGSLCAPVPRRLSARGGPVRARYAVLHAGLPVVEVVLPVPLCALCLRSDEHCVDHRDV